ncbi:MAG: Re/Si-specific NAD(P)(+) transhydrogenase subunit alpha [Spirochaetaceae bacterium]
MTVGIVQESSEGETRVALVPQHVPSVLRLADSVIIQAGSGEASGYGDKEYTERGASIVSTREEVPAQADVILRVRSGAASTDSATDIRAMKEGSTLVGFLDPYTPHESFQAMKERRISSFAMELVPRITRAQSMDALSAMANLAGYKSVLLAATELPKMFPMMMTAAGTIVPAKVFVVGVGVAGLQAIATAKRLGAVVSAYDIRPAVKDQVKSLGAKFVEMDLGTDDAEGTGGYAREMTEDFYRKQRELMTETIRESDVVITTAAVPGKRAPILVTEDMVKVMHPGTVVVDLGAERGGNCEVTEPGKTVVKHGVHVIGPINVPATMPRDASQLYSKNVSAFLETIVKEKAVAIDQEDEIVAASLVTHDGRIPNEQIRANLEGER